MLPDVSPQPPPSRSDRERQSSERGTGHEVFQGDRAALDASRTCSDGSADLRAGGFVISVLPFDELTPELMDRWERVRGTADRWCQPFFSSRFSAAVHQARGDVLVAVISEGSAARAADAVGFFPFHRVGQVGVPVGRFLNDAQNVIGITPAEVDWRSLRQACGVIAFDLHAMVSPAESWVEKYRLQSVAAYQADFAGDSIAYLRQLQQNHRTISKQAQKTRKLQREVGAIRLEVDCRCPAVLAQAITWKRQQYQRTHILDLFLPDWTRRMVEALHNGSGFSPAAAPNPTMCEIQNIDTPHQSLAAGQCLAEEPLRGLLSVLWAGDRVVAAHYGMIERGRLHYWFPTYAPEFSRYSPGTALFTELVRCASELGIDCIDMGYGEQPYKQKQTATKTQVVSGTITSSRWHRLNYTLSNSLALYVKQMPMKDKLKKAWRAINPTAGIKKLT